MIDTVSQIIRQTPDYSYNKGVFACFKRINDEWGLKFYYDERMRDKTYDLQTQAAAIELAPRLGEKFQMTTPEGDTIYGYITECIHQLAENMDEDWCPKYRELRDKLSVIMTVQDMHEANCGEMADGRFVCIDFSHCGDDGLEQEISWNDEDENDSYSSGW